MKFLREHSLINHFQYSRQFYFIITDTEGRFLYANDLFTTRTGLTAGQLSVFTIQDILNKADIKKCEKAMERCLRQNDGHAVGDLLCLRPSGSYSKICWELSPLWNGGEEPEGIQWIGIDEQKKVEEKLKESELFYRSLISDSLDGILLTNDQGRINFASPSVQKILGYAPGEMLYKNVFDFLHPDDQEFSRSAFLGEVDRSPQRKFINARVRQKSGEWMWCMIRGHNLLASPHIGAMLVYFCDDTLRKTAEIALVESEQRFRRLIQNLEVGVLLMDGKARIIICNQASLQLLGLPEKNLLQVNPIDLDWDIINESGQVFSRDNYPITVAIKQKKQVREVIMGVFRPTHNDRIWLIVNAAPVIDGDNNILYVICSFTDITEQKKLSRQLIEQELQKQKLLVQATIDGQEKERDEIGRELHDNICQRLTTTRLYLEVARDQADGELLRIINLAHKGLLDTMQEIRQLSQSLVPPSLEDIGLVTSVQDLCEPLKHTHAFTIDFQYDHFEEALLPGNLKLILFRIIQEQISNIVRHAKADKVFIQLQTQGGEVVLLVADNGKGFEPMTVRRGLGLDSINTRTGLFGGKLVVDSAPGKGCSIRVAIPL